MISIQAAKEIEAFLDAWEESLVVLTIRYFAIREQGALLLLSAELQFGSSPAVTSVENWRYETERVVAGRYQQLCEAGRSASIVRSLCEDGKVVMGQEVFHLISESGREFSIRHDPQPRLSLNGFGQPELSLTGESRNKLFFRTDLLDSELKVADVPFDDVAELLQEIGLETRLPDYCAVRVRTTALARISESSNHSKLQNGKAKLRIRIARDLEIRYLRIGWRCLADGAFHDRHSISGLDICWTPTTSPLGEEAWGEVEVEVPARASLQCFLSYKRRLQHELWLHDSDPRGNARWCVHKTLERRTGWLQRELSQEGDKRFEEAVACLFNLLGFHTVHYGKGVTDGVDVVISTSTGDLGLIECTTDSIRDDKYQKLVDRLAGVNSALGEDKLDDLRVIPLMVVRRPRPAAHNSLERGRELGVLTLVEEDLMDLLQQSRSNSDCHLQVFQKFCDRSVDLVRPANPFDISRNS